jgi:hypothetical protein
MIRNRIYADTSVFGGAFDPDFARVSMLFFDEVREGRHVLLLSDVVARELERAPQHVREFVAQLPAGSVEALPFTDEMAELRDAYISAGIVERRWRDDAAHVAAATVARADLLVSWNFKHLVKWEKIRAFNGVNLRLGYPLVTILSPREVISDEEES